jgi:hypothetical protein
MSKIDGIYTAYLTGIAGQGMAMFVFRSGKIAGADISGLTFAGSYSVVKSRIKGQISFTMSAQSLSITGASFDESSSPIQVPIDLPVDIDTSETYRINTPIGPVNAKFVMNVGFEDTDG